MKHESLWTFGLFLVLAVTMVFAIRTMVAASPAEASGDPDLIVIGHQWWWEVRYPRPGRTGREDGVTANEIHIPVGRRLLLELQAADVIHDFWVPELGRKIDAIPGHPNQIWLEADHEGIFQGFCAEFCGASHAWMKIRVVAQSEGDYAQWLGNIRAPARAPASVSAARGLVVFRQRTCVNCHQISGVSAPNQIDRPVHIGPDLTHLSTRETLAAGALKNNATDLALWLKDPGHVKPGAHMPVFGLTQAEIDDLTSYFAELR